MAWGDETWGYSPWGEDVVLMEHPIYIVEIEFTANIWTDVSADCSHVTISRQIGTIDSGLSVGTAEVLLRNDTGKYSPSNATSPYFPNVTTYKNVRIRSTYLNGTYYLFSGVVVGYSVDPARGNRICIIQCSDRMTLLQYRYINLPLKVDINVKALLEDVLDEAGITARTIDALYDTIPFVWFRNRRPIEVLNEMIIFGNYKMYVDPAGTLKIRDRYMGLAGTSIATYNDSFVEMGYVLTPDNIANHVSVSGTPRRIAAAVTVVANLEDIILIQAGQTITLTLTYYDTLTNESGVPATEMVTPVATTDYTANTKHDSTGADKTGQLTINVTFQGASADIDIENNNSVQVYLTKMQLRGKPIQKQPVISATADDVPSQVTNGQRDYSIESEYIGTFRHAQDYAGYIIATRKNSRHGLTIGIKNVWPDSLEREIGDIITVIEPVTGINGKYVVIGIDHDIVSFDGIEHIASMQLEQWVDSEYLVLDDPVLGKLDGTRRWAF